jgi:alanine racemase
VAYIELSRKNYFHNLDILSNKLGSKDKLAVVLKDNAYGHGLQQMAILTKEYGIQTVVVRSTDEAEEINSLFDNILILSPKNYKENKKYHYVINSIEQIQTIPSKTQVHLKVDSGMHRNGINVDELETAYKLIKKNHLILEALMTHFRSADELTSEQFWQYKNWQEIQKEVLNLTQKYNFKKPLFHSANSAALLRVKNYEDDLARCGIAAYGYHQMPNIFNTPMLKPVLSLWAEKISTRTLQKGQRVGYGGAYKASKKMTVSTYDIGYGDGFFRFNGKGRFFTTDKKEFLGKISMDSCSFEGNEKKICLFTDAKEIANYFHTISYDLLTKLSPTIPRVIVD